MFWLRNKKNNFPGRTLIWRPVNNIGTAKKTELIEMKLTSIDQRNVLDQHPAVLIYLLGGLSSVIGEAKLFT